MANVRGDIVSVVELAALLGLESDASVAGRRSVLIAQCAENLVVGLLVDRVTGIRLLPASEFDLSGYLAGVTRYQGKLVQLLDLDRVLHAADVGEAHPLQRVGFAPPHLPYR